MPIIDHRGFSPTTLHVIPLDGSLESELNWIVEERSNTLWEMDFKFQAFSQTHLPSYQLAVKEFSPKIWEKNPENTLGMILYRGEVPSLPIEEFAEYLHHIAAYLPDEVAPIALFDCPGDPLYFSKEIFPHIHLGFRDDTMGVLQWKETLRPLRHDANLGVLLPLREKGVPFATIQELVDRPCRWIAEPYLTEEWDELDELMIFPDLISPWGRRMVQGFEVTGGKVTNLSLFSKIEV